MVQIYKKEMMTGDKLHAMTLRGMSKKTLHSLKRIAKENKRSLNSEIIWVCDAWVKMQEMKEEKKTAIK